MIPWDEPATVEQMAKIAALRAEVREGWAALNATLRARAAAERAPYMLKTEGEK